MKEKLLKFAFNIAFFSLVISLGFTLLKDIFNIKIPAEHQLNYTKLMSLMFFGGIIGSWLSYQELLKYRDDSDGSNSYLSRIDPKFKKVILVLCIGTFFTSAAFLKAVGPVYIAKGGSDKLIAYGVEGLAFIGLIGFIGGLIFLRGSRQNKSSWYYGTARFANKKEIGELTVDRKQGLSPGSFFLSETKITLTALPPLEAAKHVLLFGPSGSGKTRGYLMPNCAMAEETSIVVTDPKSELWKFTSGFHRKAYRFAPVEPKASEGFNWIPLCKDSRLAQICARALVESQDTGKRDPFWDETEIAYFTAIFAHTATLSSPTPMTAYKLVTEQEQEAVIEQLLNSESATAKRYGRIFSQADEKVRGGVVTGVAGKLQFLEDENVSRFTSGTLEPPNFAKLRKEPQAIYWCMREQDITRLARLSSIFFTLLLAQISEDITETNKTPIILMLDEFANIGKIPGFASTLSLARGRGIGICIVLQSLAQLEAVYGRPESKSMLTNCTTKIALHGLDFETAEYVSKMLGDSTVVANRVSTSEGSSSSGLFGSSGGSSTSSASYSTTEHKRPLLTPDEVMRLREDEALIRSGNRYPMRLKKIYYSAAPRTGQTRELGAVKALALPAGRLNDRENNRVRERSVIDIEPPPLPPLRRD